MTNLYRTPIVAPDIREILADKQNKSLEIMLDTTSTSIEAQKVRASELRFGLNGLAYFLAKGGEVQSAADSLVSRFEWIEEVAETIHAAVIMKSPGLIPILEDVNPFFMDYSTQANFHRELSARIQPGTASEPREFCEGVALGLIGLDLRGLVSE